MNSGRTSHGWGPEAPPEGPAPQTPGKRDQHIGREDAAAPAALADPRALALLLTTRQHQRGLPRQAALAWERAAFAEAFADEEPRRRVRAFLGEGK